MARSHPRELDGAIELDWGGCLLTDRGSVEDIDALIGGEAHYRGQPGTIEAMWLIEGSTPWPGPPWPRPVYRVHWRPKVRPEPLRLNREHGGPNAPARPQRPQ